MKTFFKNFFLLSCGSALAAAAFLLGAWQMFINLP